MKNLLLSTLNCRCLGLDICGIGLVLVLDYLVLIIFLYGAHTKYNYCAVCLKNLPFYFLNNLVNNQPILIILPYNILR